MKPNRAPEDMTSGEAIRSDYVTVLGLRTHIVTGGQGDPLVLLHGGAPGASSEVNWGRNVEYFVEHGYRVVAIDQPGYGRTDLPSDHSVEFRVRHARAVLDELNLDRFHLLGNSMGGYLAIRIALDDERARRLVLVAPVALAEGAEDRAPQAHRQRRASLRVYEPSLENARAITMVTLYNADLVSDELVQLRHEMSSGKRHEAQLARRDAEGPRPVGDRLGSLRTSTLIVWGLQDRSQPVQEAIPLASSLTSAEVHLFNRCGHWPQWDHAARFNALVHGFLAAPTAS